MLNDNENQTSYLPLQNSINLQSQNNKQTWRKENYKNQNLHEKKKESPMKLLAVTWNIVGSIPQQNYLLQFFKSKQFQQLPDIIFIGTQQCQRSLFWSFFWSSKSGWQNQLRKYLPNYELFQTNTLQGLHSAVLVHNLHKQNVLLLDKKNLKAGFLFNLFGNKGATSIKIKCYGQSIQFINCHLAPHQDGAQHRNQTLIRIVQNLVCKQKRTKVILLGDMNYRIQMTNKQYKEYLKKYTNNTEEQIKYSKMIQLQQLRNQQLLKVKFLPFFQQKQINFPPTYKLNLNSNVYNKKRVPGWTDRIFYKKQNLNNEQKNKKPKKNANDNQQPQLRCKSYKCLYQKFGSDHRPVVSLFQLNIEQVDSIFYNETLRQQSGCCQII